MKRIFKYLMVGLIAMAAASCEEESFVQYNPENAVAPVLASEDLAAEPVVFTEEQAGENFATFTFTEADFGVSAAARYTLYVDLKGNNFASAKKIKSYDTPLGEDSSIAISVKDLNAIVAKFIKDTTPADAEMNLTAEIEFRLTAEWMGEGNPTSVALYSNVLSATVTIYQVKSALPDYSLYDKAWVIGDYCGWNHANTLFLYDIAGDGVYKGVVDFGAKAANGWKLTGVAGWDDSCNWGVDGAAEYTEEAATSQLISGGGSGNITNYSKRFYNFSFDKASLVLTMNHGFDEVGVIGIGDDWTEGYTMTYDAKTQLFYADVVVASDTKFKFWFDKGWDFNLGGSADALENNGDNMDIAAGNYRIYLDFNDFKAPKAIVSEDMYNAGSTPDSGDGDGEGDAEGDGEGDDDTAETITVTIFCEATGWETTNLYGWNFGVDLGWPGVPADGTTVLSGQEYCYWTLEGVDPTAENPGLIFNNGSTQTVDILEGPITGNKCFKVVEATGKWNYELLELPSIKVSYTNPAAWEAVCIYGWNGPDFGGWPGQAMTQDGDNWVYYISAEYFGGSTFLIFNNNNNNAQTVDLGPFDLNGDLEFNAENAQIK